MDNTKDTLSSYPEAVREFEDYKIGNQGCSLKTVAEYLIDLRMFCRYMKLKSENQPINEDTLASVDISDIPLDFFRQIKSDEIYDYISYVTKDRENQSATRARKLSSIRSFYKTLVALRKKMPVISAGKIEFLYPDNADLLAYRRYDGETELLVLCNLREREIAKPLPVGWTDAEKLLGNYPDTADTLRPYECVVLKK